jgi:hypothetical protein
MRPAGHEMAAENLRQIHMHMDIEIHIYGHGHSMGMDTDMIIGIEI